VDAIQIRDVTKTFGAVTAVDHLSLTVPEGAIYGFIGPNGSGKTTTMRMIVGIFHPDTGSIDVLGKPMSPDRSGLIGYLPEERGIYRKMTVRSLLEFHGELRGGHKVGVQVDAWLKKFDLAPWASRSIEALSKGMTQKVQFIAAVVPAPRLLILDEPFTGLDPVSAQSIREAILELRRAGSTVVLSTHDMGVAETMCDRIFMIFRGKKVLDGTLAAIQEQYGNDTLRVTAENGAACLDGIPGVEQVRDLGQIQELRLAKSADPQDILRTLMSRTRVAGFSIARPSLHDIFIRIAGPASASDDPATELETHNA
jgi:ABC-2 type transport system ATP-binding protein